ncbi:hypothetical protein OAJ94_04865 [Deltaproteobacteria bacterium]|nr:hypothetical protein [Deltaproteobacteria bacterium]
MKVKDIFLNGLSVGISVALLMVILSHIPLGTTSEGDKITPFYHLSGALLVSIGIPFISAYFVRKMIVKRNFAESSFKLTIPVAYLTFLPVLGVSAGAANSNLETLAMIVLIGAIGGIIWSTPFAIWSYFKGRGNESISGMVGEEE